MARLMGIKDAGGVAIGLALAFVGAACGAAMAAAGAIPPAGAALFAACPALTFAGIAEGGAL